MKKKVALYCRVSSDDQKERDTIENQIEILHTYIDMKENLSVYGEFLDNGISGTIPFEQRPEGEKLLQCAAKNEFDCILVWKIDRFGRDTLSGLNAVEMLRKYNIEILSVTEPFDLNTPAGRFQFITYLNMAELERNNILDRMYLGATRAAKKGKYMGGVVPYGYDVKEGFLKIIDEEAEIVKKIYSLYINEGLSSMDIAIYLNNLGIKSSCGSGKGKRTKNITGNWRSGSIQRILSNTIYKGIHEYGKRATRRKETILRETPVIISEEIWNKAQQVKKENTVMSSRNNVIRNYLLRGLIKCKNCGKTFYGVSYKNKTDIYACSGKRGENRKLLGIKCNALNINADSIEEDIWNDCLNILKNYDSYITDLKSKSINYDDKIDSDLEQLKKSLLEKKNEKNNILSLFRKNLINEQDVEMQLKDIQNEEEKILSLISSLENKLNNYKHEDELINITSKKLKYYYNKINNLSFEDKYNIVRLLVKEIIAETVDNNGEKAIKFHVFYNLVKFEPLTLAPAVFMAVLKSVYVENI